MIFSVFWFFSVNLIFQLQAVFLLENFGENGDFGHNLLVYLTELQRHQKSSESKVEPVEPVDTSFFRKNIKPQRHPSLKTKAPGLQPNTTFRSSIFISKLDEKLQRETQADPNTKLCVVLSGSAQRFYYYITGFSRFFQLFSIFLRPGRH